MTRLIAKGLPSNFTEAKLRAEFGKFGTLTDCSLKYTKEGKFRRFAFIGFNDEDEAVKARNYFDNSFMQSSRLKVEECKPFGDETKPRAWSRYAKDSSAYKRFRPENFHSEDMGNGLTPLRKQKKHDDDERFQQFLSSNGRDKSADIYVPNTSQMETESDEDLLTQLLSDISGETKLSIIMQDLPSSVKAKNVKEWLIPTKVKGMKIVRNSSESAAFITLYHSSDVAKVLQRDGQFIGGAKVRITSVPNTASELETANEMEDFVFKDRETETQSVTKLISETGRLFVRNLPYRCSESDLQFLFKKYGEVVDLEMIINKKTGSCKGFALVTFVFPENALTAYSSLDGTIFKGRMLHILPGEEKRTAETASHNSTGSTYQKLKKASLKMTAEKAHTWNTLFLGANAVADTFAARLSVDKSELLTEVGETTAGVRMALAETELVRETRDFLIENGVQIDAFSRPCAKRSDVVFLVKNLPFGTDLDELKRMFERFDSNMSLIMPPNGVCAIIRMNNAVDARKAFRAMAYRRFRAQPLYLEWAPFDIFVDGVLENFDKGTAVEKEEISILSLESDNKHNLSAEEKKKRRRSKKHRSLESTDMQDSTIAVNENLSSGFANVNQTAKIEEDYDTVPEGKTHSLSAIYEPNSADDDEELELTANSTLFVKNLNFKTTDGSLRNKFASRFKVRSATISVKRDPSNISKNLSMGFGFVQFYRASDAEEALKDMQGIFLDGHCLELKLSHRENVVDDKNTRKSVTHLEQDGCTKILVRNIPFQATRKEMKQLFGSFGEMRAFRIPKKVGSSPNEHRGFGFVDYLTCADARRAFKALMHSTHFYGRRLVLEWAKTTETLEELREKAASAFGTDKAVVRQHKKKIKDIESDLAKIDDD